MISFAALMLGAPAPSQYLVIENPITREKTTAVVIGNDGRNEPVLFLSCQTTGSISVKFLTGYPEPLTNAKTIAHRFGKQEKASYFEWAVSEQRTLYWDETSFGASTGKARFIAALAEDTEVHFQFPTYDGNRIVSLHYSVDQSHLSRLLAFCNPKKVIRELGEMGSALVGESEKQGILQR